ncbi:hypothetical protein HNI00_03515 [Thermoleptolyngbya oregonensis NK1-22]|uniref:Uncharacterized protein n=1 Tax=Thermoleptolyngbya oregonensis NK1-22 TaxID=2547457 RepID=A0AA96Y5N0_9CYAN|nr:hypothetical protein [Thermoleptolyngbya oregonensis]WOB42333.1 hypothetical protein HNI00_03515 [Thermoleptolyngbya oregonensis NK1-22]
MNLHFPEDALTLALILGAIALALPLLGWLLRVAGSLISSAISILILLFLVKLVLGLNPDQLWYQASHAVQKLISSIG